MAKCVSCEKPTYGEVVVIIDDSKSIVFGYSYLYKVCNKCQGDMLKTLEAIPNMLKGIQDYDERRERFGETRNWCRECWQDISEKNKKNPSPRWTMLFVDVNGFVKNISYLHKTCCKKFISKFGIYNKSENMKPSQTQMSMFSPGA